MGQLPKTSKLSSTLFETAKICQKVSSLITLSICVTQAIVHPSKNPPKGVTEYLNLKNSIIRNVSVTLCKTHIALNRELSDTLFVFN